MKAGYPHEGGCEGCRQERVCNACGGPITQATRCTNGRCLSCHARHCTGHGTVEHGYGTIGRDAPPHGWKVNNPDWPKGEGPHLVRVDEDEGEEPSASEARAYDGFDRDVADRARRGLL